MLRSIRSFLAATIVALILCSVGPLPAALGDGPSCQKIDPVTGTCLIVVTPPPSGGGGGGGNGGGGGGGGGGAAACTDNTWGTPGPIACSQSSPRFGVSTWWSNERQCYIGLAPASYQSQPIYWEGHPTDGGGAIYFCEPPTLVGGGQVVIFFWSLTPPAGPAAPPDPRVLAQQAIATMGLRAVAIGIVPEARAGSVGIIGMPTWMWVADPGEQTWGPMTRSASAGGYTVTATAKVDRVVWVMGDGSTVTCTTKGTPYADSFGKKSSPDCGHTYTRQGTYVVAATSYWTVAWAGIGQTGTIPLDFTQQATIVMGESQVLSN